MKKKRTDVLFDFVVVVKLQEGEKGERPVPVVDYRYPPTLDKNDPDAGLIDNILQFCFPDIASKKVRKKKTSRRKTFRFVLTDMDGSKKFGYCVRSLPESGAGSKRYPECFCLISFLPCFSLFKPILKLVEEKRKHMNRTQIFHFLQSILAHPFPSPGSAIEVRCISQTGTGDMERHTFIRPPDSDNMLAYMSVTNLLANVSERNILRVWASLLKERPIIICGKDLDVVADCVQTFVALLYPFTWQGALIPVMAESMLDMACAPVPFLLGVLKEMMPRVKEMKKEGAIDAVMRLDVDKNDIRWDPFPQDWDGLPKPERTALEKQLESFKKQYKSLINSSSSKEDDDALPTPSSSSLSLPTSTSFTSSLPFSSNYQPTKRSFPSEHLMVPFIDFFGRFFGSTCQAAFLPSSQGGNQRVFNMELFLSKTKPEHLAFVEEFATNTQMFGIFVEEREIHFSSIKGPFERRLLPVPCGKCGKTVEQARAACPACGHSTFLQGIDASIPAIDPSAPPTMFSTSSGEGHSRSLTPGRVTRAETQIEVSKNPKLPCEKCGVPIVQSATICFACGTKRASTEAPSSPRSSAASVSVSSNPLQGGGLHAPSRSSPNVSLPSPVGGSGTGIGGGGHVHPTRPASVTIAPQKSPPLRPHVPTTVSPIVISPSTPSFLSGGSNHRLTTVGSASERSASPGQRKNSERSLSPAPMKVAERSLSPGPRIIERSSSPARPSEPPKFCTECGTANTGTKFCKECGIKF